MTPPEEPQEREWTIPVCLGCDELWGDCSCADNWQDEVVVPKSALRAAEHQRDEAREALREETERLKRVLESVGEAIQPWLEKAGPHVHLFNGEDLENFERLGMAKWACEHAEDTTLRAALHPTPGDTKEEE